MHTSLWASVHIVVQFYFKQRKIPHYTNDKIEPFHCNLCIKYTLILFCFSETKFFKADLGFRLKPGDTVELTVEEVFAHAMSPFPTKITQSEKQYVLFSGNHYYYTPYTVKRQSTTVSLATSSVESHSKLKPTSVSDNAITYGPYSDVEAFQVNPMRVHFENNTPFLSVSRQIVYT